MSDGSRAVRPLSKPGRLPPEGELAHPGSLGLQLGGRAIDPRGRWYVTMSGPEPAPGQREGVSPDILGLLSVLELGQGVLLLVSGGTPAARRVHLRTLHEAARGRGARTETLLASSFDREVPFGALLPWFSRWAPSPRHTHESDPSRPGHSGRGRGGSAPLPMVALVGLLDSPGGESIRRMAATPVGNSPGLSGEKKPVVPEDVRRELLELIEGRARGQPTLLSIEGAELLDSASSEWLRRLSGELNHLPFILALSFDREGPELSAWQTPTEGVSPAVWRRLPPPPPQASGLGGPSLSLLNLTVEVRRLLVAALVAGPDARVPILSEALGTPPAEIEKGLQDLRSKEWLEQHEGAWRALDPPAGDRALADVGAATVLELHRNLARAIEKSEPQPRGSLVFRLGDHWARAGALEKAVPLLRASALECERWGAPELSEDRLQRALVMAQAEPGKRARELEEQILAQMGILRLRAENPTGSVESFQKALKIAQARGAPARVWGAYVARMSHAQMRLGIDPEPEIQATLEKVRGLHPEVEALLLRALAAYHLAHSRPDEAIQAAEKACALAEKGSDPILTMRVRITAATCYLFGGRDLERPKEHLLKALQLRDRVEGNPEETIVVDALDQLALVELNRGSFAQAHDRGEEALLEARRLGSRTSLLGTLGNVCEYACAAERWDRARQLAQEMRRLCERYDTPETDDSTLQLLLVEGMIAGARKDPKTALRKFEHLVGAAEKAGTRYFVAQGLLYEALLMERENDRQGARQIVRRLHRDGLIRGLGEGNRAQLEKMESRLGDS